MFGNTQDTGGGALPAAKPLMLFQRKLLIQDTLFLDSAFTAQLSTHTTRLSRST
jgi:hypothetical protein